MFAQCEMDIVNFLYSRMTRSAGLLGNACSFTIKLLKTRNLISGTQETDHNVNSRLETFLGHFQGQLLTPTRFRLIHDLLYTF